MSASSLPVCVLKALFSNNLHGNSRGFRAAPDDGKLLELNSVYILTNCGEVFLLLLAPSLPILPLYNLAHTILPVVWIGELMDGSQWSVCLVHRNGDCALLEMCGGMSPGWTAFSLPHVAVCCCTTEDFSQLVASDGSIVSITKVNVSKATKSNCMQGHSASSCNIVNLDTAFVKIHGVVSLQCNNDVLILTTADRRRYKCALQKLFEKSNKFSESKKNQDKQITNDHALPTPSIDVILQELEKHSSAISVVDTRSTDLNCYIEQLNLASQLYLCTSERCGEGASACLLQQLRLDWHVEACAAGDHVFTIRCSLVPCKNFIKFRKRWWRLTITLHTCSGAQHATFCPSLTTENSPQLSTDQNKMLDSVVLTVTRQQAQDLLTNQDNFFITCSATLNDYCNNMPIASFPVVKDDGNILKFLCKERTLAPACSPLISFEDALHGLQLSDGNNNSSSLTAAGDHKISLSFSASNAFLFELVKSLQIMHPNASDVTSNNPRQLYPITQQLWYCDSCIIVSARLAGTDSSSIVNIVLNSVCVPLLVAVKRALRQLQLASCAPTSIAVSTTSSSTNHEATAAKASNKSSQTVAVILSDSALESAYTAHQLAQTSNCRAARIPEMKTFYYHVSQLISSLQI